MNIKATFSVIFVFVGVSAANADSATEIVKARQSDMKSIAVSTKAMAGMFNAPDTYVSSVFQAAAGEIVRRAGGHLVSEFQDVTVSTGSKATDAVAKDRARFAELAENLRSYAAALEEAARAHPGQMTQDMRMKAHEPMEGGLFGTAIRSPAKMSAEHAFHLMLQTCASCHSRFRERD